MGQTKSIGLRGPICVSLHGPMTNKNANYLLKMLINVIAISFISLVFKTSHARRLPQTVMEVMIHCCPGKETVHPYPMQWENCYTLHELNSYHISPPFHATTLPFTSKSTLNYHHPGAQPEFHPSAKSPLSTGMQFRVRMAHHLLHHPHILQADTNHFLSLTELHI
jgi:hypothetical protein